jgi:hypothetical protein
MPQLLLLPYDNNQDKLFSRLLIGYLLDIFAVAHENLHPYIQFGLWC